MLEPVESAKYDKTAFPVQERWGLVVRNEDVDSNKKEITYREIASMPLILPRRYIVLEEISSWLKVEDKDLTVAAYHNLPSNALSLVSAGMGALLCVEGSYSNRKKEGLRFIPATPKRVSGHVAVKKKNRTISKAASLFWEVLGQLKNKTEEKKLIQPKS